MWINICLNLIFVVKEIQASFSKNAVLVLLGISTYPPPGQFSPNEVHANSPCLRKLITLALLVIAIIAATYYSRGNTCTTFCHKSFYYFIHYNSLESLADDILFFNPCRVRGLDNVFLELPQNTSHAVYLFIKRILEAQLTLSGTGLLSMMLHGIFEL